MVSTTQMDAGSEQQDEIVNLTGANYTKYAVLRKRTYLECIWAHFGVVINWMSALLDDDVGEKEIKENASREVENYLNIYDESSQDVQKLSKDLLKLVYMLWQDSTGVIAKQMNTDVLPVVEKYFNGIAETIRIFQTTQNMELPQKVSTILDSLPSQFQATTADLEEIKRKLLHLQMGLHHFQRQTQTRLLNLRNLQS